MSLNSQYSTAARNAAAAALGALCNGGKLRLYDGTQPVDANTAVTSQNLIAEHPLANPAFGAPGSGIVTAVAIASASAVRAGTVTWCRIVQSDGTTVVMDGSVGTATSNVILNAVVVTLPSLVTITSLTLTESAAGT